MFTKHHTKCCPKRSPFRWVSKIMSRKHHEAPRKVSSKTESFGCIPKILSRKRREKYNACIGEIPTLKTIFSIWIHLIYVHETPRKVSSKTESVWSGFKNNESKASRNTT